MRSNLKFFRKRKTFPVDDFFQNVLYDTKNGYYANKQPFGKNGDFITAPKISNLFSEIIAIWIISAWHTFGKPKNFNVIEPRRYVKKLICFSTCPAGHVEKHISFFTYLLGSITLKFLGLPKVCHAEIIQIAIISENKFDIFGAVIKSPFFPKGCLFA